ncbi:alpha/beta fold hydrolase [Aeromicrobium chenweiae]|uniref:Alpha/beta hydrolase n=1 Tax=Aeromicrobium chenweiae TaxID=2079793 RepID=A0A2S0WQE3_9ACTN|nr:alpha/beta hydrolase [Aeromicrobium chenweiae]AWB93569.1 alpha/beta hydrolase [Aeromicrobium chenweiae]TGN33218.1 alpha/beta hydrolase [Aeromicrobium chenweiae]
METTTSADGTTLAFDRLGAGPPVVLLPGATCTRGVTAPLAAALAEHLTVLNLDRRGRGQSDDMGDPPPYDPRREVEDVAALVRAAGGSAAVYGHSSGAGVALRAAAADVGVTRLVLHDAPYSSPGGEQRARDWDAELHALLLAQRDGDAVAAFLRMVGTPAELVDGMRGSPHWPALEAVAPSLAYDSAAMGDHDGGLVPEELLPAVTVPTLVLVGGADHGFMVDVARQLADGLPDARLEQLVGAGHDAGPDVVVPALLPFLLG